jgi:ADP-ribose pyrophosphatase YjhB (NUDIX family)
MKLVADVQLYGDAAVVLVKYENVSKYDGERGWFLPDDYLVRLEHPRDAAARIVREQLGLEPPELELADIESLGNGDWHLTFHYRGELGTRAEIRPGANVAAAEWFSLDSLPDAADVAHHGWALDVNAQGR